MWLEAIVTREDLVQLLDQLLPLKINLDAPSKDRWIHLGHATDVVLVADAGMRVSCPAELKWEIAGVGPTLKVETIGVLLRPDVVEHGNGHTLDFHVEIEDVDIHGVPSVIESAILRKVNAELETKKLSWNFTKTLGYSAPIGALLESIDSLDVAVAWGKRRITAEGLALAVSFKVEFVRAD
jgi:hypothetical protein